MDLQDMHFTCSFVSRQIQGLVAIYNGAAFQPKTQRLQKQAKISYCYSFSHLTVELMGWFLFFFFLKSSRKLNFELFNCTLYMPWTHAVVLEKLKYGKDFNDFDHQQQGSKLTKKSSRNFATGYQNLVAI